MQKRIVNKGQVASDYDDRTTIAVRSVLIEIGQVLGSFKRNFVFVGFGLNTPITGKRLLGMRPLIHQWLRLQRVSRLPKPLYAKWSEVDLWVSAGQ